MIVISCVCGKSFQTDDKNAGKKVRCPQCQALLRVPVSSQNLPDSAKPQPGYAQLETDSDIGQVIKFSCDCGADLKEPIQHAGRRIRCQHCGKTLTIPKPTTRAIATDSQTFTELDEGKIKFACKCGKKFKVSPELANHKSKCPSCGAIFLIPGIKSTSDSQTPELENPQAAQPHPAPAQPQQEFAPDQDESWEDQISQLSAELQLVESQKRFAQEKAQQALAELDQLRAEFEKLTIELTCEKDARQNQADQAEHELSEVRKLHDTALVKIRLLQEELKFAKIQTAQRDLENQVTIAKGFPQSSPGQANPEETSTMIETLTASCIDDALDDSVIATPGEFANLTDTLEKVDPIENTPAPTTPEPTLPDELDEAIRAEQLKLMRSLTENSAHSPAKDRPMSFADAVAELNQKQQSQPSQTTPREETPASDDPFAAPPRAGQWSVELPAEMQNPGKPLFRLCASIEPCAHKNGLGTEKIFSDLVQNLAVELCGKVDLEIKPWANGITDAFVMRLIASDGPTESGRSLFGKVISKTNLEIEGEILSSTSRMKSLCFSKKSKAPMDESKALEVLTHDASALAKQVAEAIFASMNL